MALLSQAPRLQHTAVQPKHKPCGCCQSKHAGFMRLLLTACWCQDSNVGSIVEAQINGVRVHAASVPANLVKHPADLDFKVSEEHDLLELLERNFHVRVRAHSCARES